MMLKTVRLFALLVGVVVLCSVNAYAFHDGGVARCSACHTMHNSQNGQMVDSNSPNGNPWLLKDATPSDVCLSCHAYSRGNVLSSSAHDPLNPTYERGAGNFVFLFEDNLFDGHGSSTISGDAAGHNLNAPGYGLTTDATLTTAPGGNYSSSLMGCSSCHDPHGTEHFRLLHGAGDIQDGAYTFTNPAPEAVGRSYSTAESNSDHTAYLSGMSAWCANCHGDFHQRDGGSKLIHPSGETVGGTIATIYDLYNGTSDQTGGSHATAYLAAVPFEDAANTTTSTAGPTASSKVMCLTCHRAHATSAPDAGRWDFQLTALAEDGEGGAYAIPNPYDGYQRSLCNKCHRKDIHDEMEDFTPVP